MHKRNCMARPTIPAGYEAITSAKALQTLEKLVTQNHDFDFFEEKNQCKPHTSVYTYKIDSESLERIKIAMERTNNTQASQQHARTNQTTLHKQNTCKHNSSTVDIASADVSASASTNLRARKRGKRAGLGGTSDTTSATLTRLFALTLLNSQNQSHRINQTKRRQER